MPDPYHDSLQPNLAPHRGVLVLVLGILSIVMFPLIGPVAWYLGKADLADMDAGTMDPEGRDMTNVGRILGMVGTALLVLSVVSLFVGLLLFAGLAVTASG